MTSLVDLSVTDRYRSAADGFARRVAGTTDWDSPTPVAQWRARDVVGHLTSWLPALVASGCEVRLDPVPSAEEDPVGAWAGLDAQIRSLLDAPVAAIDLTLPGDVPLDGPRHDLPDATVSNLLADRAALIPDADALVFEGTRLTYAELEAAVAKTKALTDKPFGVNLTVLPTIDPPPYDEYLRAAVESGITIIETAGSNPAKFLPYLKDNGVKVIHKCTSVRHALKAQRLGVDKVFGRGTTPGEVASYLVHALVDRPGGHPA